MAVMKTNPRPGHRPQVQREADPPALPQSRTRDCRPCFLAHLSVPVGCAQTCVCDLSPRRAVPKCFSWPGPAAHIRHSHTRQESPDMKEEPWKPGSNPGRVTVGRLSHCSPGA